jgi:SAM-dependent methyltransferase
VTDDPYAGIAAIYDHWCAEVTEDVPFYRAVCDGATGPIVEIGGGTGRIAIPLALGGHRVIALDRSRPMLERLAERAAAAGVSDLIEGVEADLRALPPLPPVDRVIAPFRVLMHLADDGQRASFLAAVAELLVPGGMLIFDVLEPTRADIRSTQGLRMQRPSGVHELARWDERARRLDLEVSYRGHATTMRLHWIPGDRWRALLEDAGFEVLAAYAGFDGQPFTGERGDSAWIALRT